MKKSKIAKKVAATALSLGILGGGLFAGCSTPKNQANVVPPTTNQTTEDNYQSQLDQFKQELENLQAENDQFKSELEDMQGEIDNLKNDIKTLNTKYTEFITNYNALEFTVEMLRKKTETNSENISSLQEDISTANGLISKLQANIAELKQLTQNTELGDKVATLESMLNNMSLSVYKLQLTNIVDNTFINQSLSIHINQSNTSTDVEYFLSENGKYGYLIDNNTYVASQDDLVFTNKNGKESISSVSENDSLPSLIKHAINSAEQITTTGNQYICTATENGQRMSINVNSNKISDINYYNTYVGDVYGQCSLLTENAAQAQISYIASKIPSYTYYNEAISYVDEMFGNSYVDINATMQDSVDGEVEDNQIQHYAASNKHVAVQGTSELYGEHYGICNPTGTTAVDVIDGNAEKSTNDFIANKPMLHDSLKEAIKEGLSEILYDDEQDEYTITSNMYGEKSQVKLKMEDGHLKMTVAYSELVNNQQRHYYTQNYDISATTKENFQQFYKQVEGQINEYLSQLELSK